MTHRTGLHSAGPRRRLRLAAVIATATTAAAMASAVPAHAATIFKTTTALAVTPASTTFGQSVTLTATVKISGINSLGITPKGTVTFTSKNSSGAVFTLGSTSLSSCFLAPCKATIVTSAAPVGTTTAIATYGGDSYTSGSSGSHALTVAPVANPGTSSTVTCYAGQPCDTGTINATDTTSHVDVVGAPSGSTQTVSASFGTGSLSCVEPEENGRPDNDGDDDDGVFVGTLVTFSSTATDAGKTITYTGTGNEGAIMSHQLGEHPNRAGCYASANEFNGFTNGHFGAAPQDSNTGLFVAILATCAFTGNVRPCVTGVAGSGTTYEYVVSAPAGDPKFIP
jgi:hypothetical protein